MIIASAKNKSVGNAFVASVFFGFFALLYYIFARSEEPKTSQEEKDTFSCSNCDAEIPEHSDFCPKCGVKFKEDRVKCSKCKTINLEDNKFCSKCGFQLIEDPEENFICGYCNKEFKSESKLESHSTHCVDRKHSKEKDEKIIFWFVSILVTLMVSLIFYMTNPINIIPTLLIFFVITPYFDKLFNKYKKKNKKIKHFEFSRWKKAIVICGIILLFVLINIIIPKCPKTCDDSNLCSNDFCSSETGYKCMNTIKLNCNGNNICESGEYGNSKDCPDCDDGKKCTADTYGSGLKECIHTEMKGCTQ